MKSKRKNGVLGGGLEDRGTAIRARTRRTDANGKRQEVSETFRYEADVHAAHRHSRPSAVARAQAWIAEQKRALRLDKAKVGERMTDLRLSDWCQRYRHEIDEAAKERKTGKVGAVRNHALKRSASKEANVLLGWEARFPRLCAMQPEDITPKHIRDAMGELSSKHKLKPGTINRWVAVLSAVFVAAAEEWHFAIANPIHRMPRPSANDNRDRLIEDDELKQVLLGIHTASQATRKAIEFLRWTACRRSEATKLDWKDIDWRQPIVEATFRETKDPRGRVRNRTIPMAPEAEAVLRELFEGEPPKKGRVFAVHPDTITTAWERGCARAGVDNARVHDLRHTRLTEITAVLPLLDAQRISGHLDLRMLQRYYHPKAQEIGRRWLELRGKPLLLSRGTLSAEKLAVVEAVEGMLRAQGIDTGLLLQRAEESAHKDKKAGVRRA